MVYVWSGTFCKTSVPRSDELFALFGLFAGITGCMQNLILNNMQPKVQLDDEREPEHSGRSSQSWLGSREPLASVAPTDHSFGAGPTLGRAQLRPGLLLKIFFGPTRGRR